MSEHAKDWIYKGNKARQSLKCQRLNLIPCTTEMNQYANLEWKARGGERFPNSVVLRSWWQYICKPSSSSKGWQLTKKSRAKCDSQGIWRQEIVFTNLLLCLPSHLVPPTFKDAGWFARVKVSGQKCAEAWTVENSGRVSFYSFGLVSRRIIELRNSHRHTFSKA